MKKKSKIRRLATSLLVLSFAVSMFFIGTASVVMAEDEQPADIQDTYTIDGVTYYNTDSDSFASDPEQYIKDVLLGKSSELVWPESGDYTYDRSMTDLWLEAAAGLLRGKDYMGDGRYTVAIDKAACQGSQAGSYSVGNKTISFLRYPYVNPITMETSYDMKSDDMKSPKDAEKYLWRTADLNGDQSSTGYFKNSGDADAKTTFVAMIKATGDSTRVAAVYFNNFKVVALFPEDAGKNYVTSSVEDEHYSDISASNVKNNTAESISTTQTASRNYSWQVSSSVSGSKSFSLEKSVKVSAEFKFGIFEKLGIEAGVTTTDAFEQGWSKEKTYSDDKGTQQEISVDLPPYTNVMMTQKTTTADYTTRYNCPVGVTYDATVVIYDKNGVYSVDGSPAVFAYQSNAGQNLQKRYQEWKDEAQTGDPDGVRWYYATALDSTGDTHIAEAIGKTATYIPMSPTGAQFTQKMNVIAGEVAGLMPIYPLKKITTDQRAMEMAVGDTVYTDDFSLSGFNEKNSPYYGFNEENGTWKIVDEDGVEITENAPLEISQDKVTKEWYVKAVGSGTCYLKYYIDEDAYATAEHPDVFAKNDDIQTAFIKVTVPYQVTFKFQNGKKDKTVDVRKGETVEEPEVADVQCKKPTGWFTDEACTDEYDFDEPVTGDLTLYCGWKDAHTWKTSYTIDKQATLAAAGSKSIHCSVCDAVKPGSKVTIPKKKVTPTTLSKVVPGKKAFTAKWTKKTGINGYQIQYALNNKFTKSVKKVKITKAATVSKKISKLKAKKKYFVRIRTFKNYNGKTYWSTWSKYKAVTTKK